MMNPLRRTVRLLATGLLVLVAPVAWPVDHTRAGRPRVTAVTLQEVAGEVRVSIATTGPARYQQRAVHPQWVVVDVQGAELGIPAGTLPFSGGVISKIRVGQFTSDVVRVVVEFVLPVPARVAPSSDGTALIIGIPARGADAQVTATATGSGRAVRGGIAKVTGIALWGAPGRPWVSIIASGPVRYQLRNIEPDWVVIDISRAQLALALGRQPGSRGLVKQIRIGQFAPSIVRVVLELAQPVPVHVATSADKTAIVVTLRVKATTLARSTHAPADRDAVGLVLPVPGQQATASAQPLVSVQSVAGTQPAPGRPSATTAQSGIGPAPAPAPQTDGRSSGGAFLLGSEDVLEITVWGYPDLTRVVTVRPDGQVAVPLAGTVPAAGRSVERLTQDLTRAFAKYIINPQVTVIVKEFRKMRISVLGQVTKPGTYTLPPGTRILDAISAASGVTDNAALNQAQLVRATGDTQPLSLDGLLVQQDMRQNLILESGDTLIIPEDTRNKFYVLGDVNRPGIYPLKGDVTVLQALAIAGGPVLHGTSTSTTAHIVRRIDPNQGPLTATARAQDVQPIANGNGALITKDLQKMYKGDLSQNETLRPGDVMVVPAPGAAALPTILSIISILLGIRP